MAEYVLATDDDFGVDSYGNYIYIGSDDYVEIPHVIKGVNVTTYNSMFDSSLGASSVKGVKSTNEGIVDMSFMFRRFESNTLDLTKFHTSNVVKMRSMFIMTNIGELDLTSFDTSNVTTMTQMFSNSQVVRLNLSSFDTFNVEYMEWTFENSKVPILDLSSFDTSKIKGMGNIFNGAQATIGYARTQEDADRFNTSSGKPAGLNFIVKPKPSLSINVGGRWVELATKEYADEKLGGGS